MTKFCINPKLLKYKITQSKDWSLWELEPRVMPILQREGTWGTTMNHSSKMSSPIKHIILQRLPEKVTNNYFVQKYFFLEIYIIQKIVDYCSTSSFMLFEIFSSSFKLIQ